MLGKRVGLLALCVTAILVGMGQPASARKRVALVIGNSAYEHTGALANPANDAKLIAAVLQQVGFDVSLHLNLDLKGMRRAIAQLGALIRTHGTNSIALVYYAGHGVQLQDTNYLIPVDAKVDIELDAEAEAVSVTDITDTLNRNGAGLKVLILDACRDNPYRSAFRSGGRQGLARIEGQRGYLIAFSTDPGRAALDGPDGSNSPYTKSLANALSKPGLKIEEAFRLVRKEVYESTRGSQVPYDSSNFVEDFYMAGEGNSAKGGVPAIPTERKGPAIIEAGSGASSDAEMERLRAEIAKAEADRKKAQTDMQRAKAESELAKLKAEAELERMKADAEVARMKREAEALRVAAAEAQKRSLPTTGSIADMGAVFNPSAIPSFNCSEYAKTPVDHASRNPQTDLLCISVDAANADYRLGLAFQQYTRGLSAAAKRDVITQQKDWILARNQRCAASWGDLNFADQRARIAQCLIAETNARILILRR